MTLDRPTVLSGLPGELRAFGALVSPLGPEDLRRPTRCSGWNVADVAGHVVGTVVDVAHGRIEGQGTAAVTERQAKERTGRTGAELADELSAAVPTLIALLESMSEDSWTGPSLVDPAAHRADARVELADRSSKDTVTDNQRRSTMTKSKPRTRLLAASAAAGLTAAVTVMTAGTAAAVGPHQHTLTNPAGTHGIAGGFCNGNFAEGTPQNVAIATFHENIHIGPNGPDGVVTLGSSGCS